MGPSESRCVLRGGGEAIESQRTVGWLRGVPVAGGPACIGSVPTATKSMQMDAENPEAKPQCPILCLARRHSLRWIPATAEDSR